jgi:hypothetical protein
LYCSRKSGGFAREIHRFFAIEIALYMCFNLAMRFLLIVLFCLSGCGSFAEKFSRQSGDHTPVQFSVENLDGNPLALLPGIMIYAVRADNVQSRASIFLTNETTSAPWPVPNGVYNFYGVAYGSANLTGTMYCGRANQIALTGASVTVPIDLRSTGQCGTAPFSPPGFNEAPNPHQPRLLYLGFCAASGGSLDGLDDSVNDCDGISSNPAAGSALRVKLSILDYTKWDPNTLGNAQQTGQMTSGCLGSGFSGFPSSTTARVPYGEPFALAIEAFSDTGCNTSIGSYSMMAGVINSANNTKIRFRNASDALVFPGLQMMRPISGSVNALIFLRNF